MACLRERASSYTPGIFSFKSLLKVNTAAGSGVSNNHESTCEVHFDALVYELAECSVPLGASGR